MGNNNKTYYKRSLNIDDLIFDRSCFLFAPRQAGKSSFLKHQLSEKPVLFVDLLDRAEFLEFQRNPTLLRERLAASNNESGLVIIDEIQKIPELLDEIHWLIENKNTRFIMSGSSARKLKRAGSNLLGGRARMRHLHGFSCSELPNFDLKHAIHNGTLPPHYLSRLPDEDLASYVGQYLTEEIAAEGLVRNLPSFARFLEVAASCNGQILNYSSIASDTGINRQTVSNYFQILKDTMLGFELQPFRASVKRKSAGSSKFYLSDMGVVRFLRRLEKIVPASSDFGSFFEHFIFLELRAFLDYFEPQTEIGLWRTEKGEVEVDFIVGKRWGIEVKASERITNRHLDGLKKLGSEQVVKKLIVVSCEPHCRHLEEENIRIYPWQDFMHELWEKKGWLWN
ncbi:MAG: ATP-binding protein [Candidatus Riflebacteria bacterium]|nr:ATP-binding protein [Candidatus Riflebacteria bacterium]